MPNWKKLLSSGSSGSLAHLSVDTSVEATSFTGSLLSTNGVISGSSQVDITQASGYTTFSSSIQTYTDDKVASLVDSAPGTLDTLNELAAALNDDPNFSASIATTIGTKLATATFNTYSSSAAPALRTEYVAGDNALSSSTATALRAEYVAGDSALSASAHTQRVALYEINSASIAALDGDFATDSELNNLSASVDAHLDANILALSASVDTHLDANISALSASVDTHLDANISSLSSSAHTARVNLSGSQKTYIDAKVAGLVDSAPATLDTLNELAAALNDDPNFSASIATSIGNRVLTSTFNTYSGSAAGALRTEYKAGDAALSSSAHTQRVAIASSIPTNNNQLTNGAGYITSFDITTQTDSKYLRSDTSDTMTGVLTIQTPDDNQLVLQGTDTWAGIGFDDSNSEPSFIWYNGVNQTFAIGGGGANVSGKKLHVDGAVSIGSNSDSTSVPTNGLHVEGAVVLKGQHTFDASRDSYWDYNDKVALQIMPAADDGAVAILFPSIGNSPSDFAYIAYDEDYGEAGVDPGENGALILACENDGAGSSDHVRVKGRLVVEADTSSSDPTYALQVKSSNTTSDLFNVARAGGGYLSGTFNVTGDVVAYYSSDERLKDNLVPIGNALEKVKQLTGYEFDWNDKQDVYEGHDIGVVAQEVEKVLPEVVTTRDNGYKAVKYEKLVALLIQSNKELIERVELLEKQLNVK